MEVGLSDSGMAGGKVVDLVGLCLKLGGVGGRHSILSTVNAWQGSQPALA